ncbi:MvaI/BcnI family restriction endonuclease [Pseudoalteromonas rubra]|uniref:MvaI/BcnI family restriction endonuclease n=1 Tax=Pseudoalteromonas rubra TaxID=43658 RepID=UPI000F76EAC7|nr:MvaI/BcnI family restriction endonuclease [Pseudoalteromonas rubra]
MDPRNVQLKDIEAVMKHAGATRVIFKELKNNDNSKQQIYLGTNFEVIRTIPTGQIKSAGTGKKGATFKASINFDWISLDGATERAKGAQLILYPKYPEVRLSGILTGCHSAPSHLMQPPTKEERQERDNKYRILVLGIVESKREKDQKVLAYMSSWDDALSSEVSLQISKLKLCNNLIREQNVHYDPQVKQSNYLSVATVFYEQSTSYIDSRQKLLERLKEIYQMGKVPSQRLDKFGNVIPYKASNGAGYTLESLFEITPNGRSEPDFLDWELKSHSKGNPVTLMTPEPCMGVYQDDLFKFMNSFGRKTKENQYYFTGMHKANSENKKTGLTFSVEGYDAKKKEIANSEGGLFLRDRNGEIAACWKFDKLIEHWKRKHAKTCFVSYSTEKCSPHQYSFGPEVRIATGANLNNFINAIVSQAIYYDPGVKIELSNGTWRPKKRNQFRIKWKDTKLIYESTCDINLEHVK